MSKLTVFNSVSVDGYFTDTKGDMSWAHQNDPEWQDFTRQNVSGEDGVLLFGRVTYEMMAGYWPTPQAKKQFPEVADRMNSGQKVVFSRSLNKADWNNTRLIKNDLPGEVRRLKSGAQDMVILGSGTIVSQLAQENLIDQYQLIVNPIVLGDGRTLFDGMKNQLRLKRVASRTFKNGNVLLTYEPA
ncbi:MAG TPA: dihydrofolate reductase family protein [Gemmatimonadaceae bacterium]|nr:dihydrofolate reductase family protein [Gemmatimonadaceae bacterium]